MKRKGALMVNLGSPNSPRTRDVRRYLREFLMDGRVLDAAYPVRFFVVHGCILPFRPRQSAEAYHKIWLPEGSPLIVTSRRVRDQLQKRVEVPVELAMRYQNPSIKSALRRLLDQGVDEILLISMFPHYAMSSFETAVERVRRVLKRMAPRVELKVVPPYYKEPGYIDALVASAADYLNRDFDHLLFSFHGLPERHVRQADPTGRHCLKVADCCGTVGAWTNTCYRAQCFKTAHAFMDHAEVPVSKSSISFQSRLGREPWLKPYTDVELARLPSVGVKKLLVMCPAFVTDCLETLEEIGMRGREIFLAAGGKEFQLVPCLNEQPRWLDFLEQLVNEFASENEEGVFAR